MLPYFLGCPSWSESAWRGSLYPAHASSAEFLSHYARVFNAVEGNTTFYASPSVETVARWAARMPAELRFCAKLPREVSHNGDLRANLDAAETFRRLLAPLGPRVAPYWLQLPASFTPARLAELHSFLEPWQSGELAVEVRHPAFFDKGEDERRLNRLLHGLGIERICLDSRALFSCDSRARPCCMLKPKSRVYPCVRQPLVSRRRCALLAIPSCRPMTHLWPLGWTKWRAGSRRGERLMCFCTPRTTAWRRNWRSAFISSSCSACPGWLPCQSQRVTPARSNWACSDRCAA